MTPVLPDSSGRSRWFPLQSWRVRPRCPWCAASSTASSRTGSSQA